MTQISTVPASTGSTASGLPAQPDKLKKMHDTAVKLEATFLAEMFKHAGLGEMKGEFSGGVGEEQFSSFLREQQSQMMAQAGGIGLAETIFEAMKARAGDEPTR